MLRSDGKQSLLTWMGLGSFALVAAFSYLRLYFGVDLTDESYYVALPVSFANGYRPFQDEIEMGQFAGLLLTPFIRLYLSILDSKEGVVLFARHLYFFTTFFCCPRYSKDSSTLVLKSYSLFYRGVHFILYSL